MHAFEMLIREHEKVERQLREILNSENNHVADTSHIEKVHQIIEQLRLHMEMEEQVLYPAARQIEDLKTQVRDAYSEHGEMKQVINKLWMHEQLKASECRGYLEQWLDILQHHVKEEEEEIFPKMQNRMTNEEIEKLGNQMDQIRRQEISYREAR